MELFNFAIACVILCTLCDSALGAALSNTRIIVCPSDDFILLPGEQCNQFYLCSNGQPTLLECDPGENFNPDTAFCEEGYECEVPPAPEPTTTTTEAPEPTTTTTTITVPTTTSGTPPTTDDGFLPVLLPTDPCPEVGAAYRIHGESCLLYYYCRDGVERLQSCSVFNRFDIFRGQCLPKADATCFPGTEVFIEYVDDADYTYSD